ncbi:MAG: site-specific DNA-methyltransferase [Oscillospiraceae bacterium]|nr:site-specific DNA-methyltransferase [Oscillospiraceae bacterium]
MEEYIDHIYNEDCIVGMNRLPDKSVDMILTDLPYGITGCRWDSLLPFDQLWAQYLRIIKDRGAICLTSAQPFTTRLISSQPKRFRYCWYWYKNMPTGFTFAKYQPLRCVEEVCVFYKKAPTYNPQGIIMLDKPIRKKGKHETARGDCIYHTDSLGKDTETCVVHYPRQLLEIKCERGLHPTQKPVALFAYLIRTYTNPGALVLDSCMGSGTTAAACIKSGRKYTGFEMDHTYYHTAAERIKRLQESS